MANFNVKSVQTVVPDEATWQGVMPLSEFDQASGFAHVPYIYFYNPTHVDEVVSILKDSLGRCLSHFYPLAGRIHRVPGGRMELRCNAKGAVLVEAETTHKMAEVVDTQSAMLEKYKHLYYAVDYTRPTHKLALLYVQVTWFSCGGFSLGISISHTVTDGTGGHHFISEWTRLARGEMLEKTPYLKRDVLWASEPPCIKHPEEKIVPTSMHLAPLSVMKNISLVNLSMTRNQVEMLKTAAACDAEMSGHQRPYTRFEVLTAHIWRCMCKTRGHANDEPSAIAFPVDSRSRLSPPLPPRFFGNGVLPVATTADVGDLLSKPLGFGCSQVRRSIENVTSNYIRSDIEKLRGLDLRTMPGIKVPGEGSCTVKPELVAVSWLTLPLNGRDFGWGKETHMGAGPPTFEGNSVFFPGRGEDGSVMVAVCMDVAHAHKFKQHFYDF